MLVLDPRKGVQAYELLGDLWFSKCTNKDALDSQMDLVRNGSSSTHGSGWKDTLATARHSLGLITRKV